MQSVMHVIIVQRIGKCKKCKVKKIKEGREIEFYSDSAIAHSSILLNVQDLLVLCAQIQVKKLLSVSTYKALLTTNYIPSTVCPLRSSTPNL